MEELIRGFAEGQISRRVFIRRLVTAGVALTGAIAYADLIQADPALAMNNYVGVADYLFYPTKQTVSGPGDYVHWLWESSAGGHSVTDTTGMQFFDSSPVPNGWGGWSWVTDFEQWFWASGTWTYECKDVYHSVTLGQPMTGRVRVPILLSKASGRVGDRINLTYGSLDVSFEDFRYQLQRKLPGGAWQEWFESAMPMKGYRPRVAGKHQFRARLVRPSTGKACDWSPVVTFTAR